MAHPYTFCPFCGAAYQDAATSPRTCSRCHKKTYANPTPVAVVLLPVDDSLLVIRRNIEPRKGMLALPGGFIDLGETWQQAGQREMREETGIEISSEAISLFDVKSTPDGKILIFGLAQPIRRANIQPFADSEIQEIAYISTPQELGFPIHTEMVRRYFQRLR